MFMNKGRFITKWLAITLIMIASALSAQAAPDTLWSKRFILEGNDVAEDVVQMPDHGFLMTGDRLTIRTDAMGDTIWTRRFASHSFSELGTITPVDNNEFILSGRAYETGRSYQGWCLRIRDDGDTLWSRTCGTDGMDDFRKTVWRNDTLYVAGSSFYDSQWKVWLVALSETGDSLWSRFWNIDGNESVNDMIVTPDDNLLICGVVDADDNQNGFALKCTMQGDSLWTRIYGGDSEDAIRKVVVTPEGDFIYCGYSGSFGAASMDVWLFKTAQDGEPIWNRVYGGLEFEYGRSVMVTPDDGMIVVGSSNSNTDTNQDFYITKRNANGESIWTRLVGGDESDAAYAICPADNGGFVVVGRSISEPSADFDILMLRYDGLHADFYSETQSGYQPLNVQFHSISTGNITQWQWDTDGDGTIDAEGPDPEILYQHDGIYDVVLKITDGTYTDSLRLEAFIEVIANESPQIVDFSPVDTLITIQEGEEVQFSVNATDDHGILHYSWWLDGDDVGIPLTSWIHSFDESGEFMVACRVSDNQFSTETNWLVEVTTSLDDPTIPSETCILGAWPNPFNPTTTISFSIPKDDKVELKVYNIKGQLVKTLVDDHLEAGTHKAVWDGDNKYGKKVSSGIYLYRLESCGKSKAQKMLLLK